MLISDFVLSLSLVLFFTFFFFFMVPFFAIHAVQGGILITGFALLLHWVLKFQNFWEFLKILWVWWSPWIYCIVALTFWLCFFSLCYVMGFWFFLDRWREGVSVTVLLCLLLGLLGDKSEEWCWWHRIAFVSSLSWCIGFFWIVLRSVW